MERFISLVVAGVLGGAAGAGLIHLIGPASGGGAALSADADSASIRSLQAQMQALQHSLQQTRGDAAGARSGPGLSRRAAPTPLASNAPVALSEASMAALVKQMQASTEETVKAAFEAQEGQTKPTRRRKKKKRMSLAEASRDMNLAAHEEEELRELYDGILDKAMGLLAGPDGNKAAVRADIEAMKTDVSKTFQIMPKYLPKFLTNAGEFAALEGERREGSKRILGDERAKTLEQDYSLPEVDPIGMRANFEATVPGR